MALSRDEWLMPYISQRQRAKLIAIKKEVRNLKRELDISKFQHGSSAGLEKKIANSYVKAFPRGKDVEYMLIPYNSTIPVLYTRTARRTIEWLWALEFFTSHEIDTMYEKLYQASRPNFLGWQDGYCLQVDDYNYKSFIEVDSTARILRCTRNREVTIFTNCGDMWMFFLALRLEELFGCTPKKLLEISK